MGELKVNPRGRPPRQLEWGDGFIDDSPEGQDPPNFGITTKTPGALTLHSVAGFGMELLEQPSARTEYFTNRLFYPAASFTHARICVEVLSGGAVDLTFSGDTTSPATGSRLRLEYASDALSFASAGSPFPIEVPISEPGSIKGGWFPLVSGARADVCWQVVAVAGNGVASPRIGDVEVEFVEAEEQQQRHTLYWRALSPSAAPASVSDGYAPMGMRWMGSEETCGSFLWGVCPDVGADYVLPTASSIVASPGRLSFDKATSDLGAAAGVPTIGSGDDGHKSVGGALLRFVGAPLAEQMIRPFKVECWTAAVAPSGYTDGTVGFHLWLWRPGVGRVVADSSRYVHVVFGGATQKYVRYITRQVYMYGQMQEQVLAQDNDRWVLDVASSAKVGCFCGDQNQGVGTWVQYNGTVVPTDPDGFADFFTGVASYTSLPRFRYLALY